MTILLTLGDVTFQDFEIPETINFGGAQMLVTHKFPGGARIIDAMGSDDAEISWSGRFRGAAAEMRARQIDQLRRDGKPLTLGWSSLLFVVLIGEFRAEYRQPFEIPYSIRCAVQVDPGLARRGTAPVIDDTIGGDLADALTLAGALNLPAVSSGVALLQAAIAQAASLAGAPPATIAAIQTALDASRAAVQAALLAANANVNGTGTGGTGTGGQPAALAGALTQTAAALGQASTLYALQSSLGRMAANLAGGRV